MNESLQKLPQDGGPKRAFGRSLSDLQTEETPSRLLPAEDKLIAAVVKGDPCTFVDAEVIAAVYAGAVCIRADEGTCKKSPIRAEIIRFLALGGDSNCPVHERGIQIVGAYVTGLLNLSGCKVKSPITFLGCWFENAPSLRRSQLHTTSFRGSYAPGLDAAEVIVAGSLCLDQGFRSNGRVQIQNSIIGGNLFCNGGTFLNRTSAGDGVALFFQGAKINGSVYLSEGFSAEGQVQLRFAEIRGDLACTKGTFINRTGDGQGTALDAVGAKIGGFVSLNNGFLAKGRVWLRSAEIGGNLECQTAKIRNRTTDGAGNALDALGAKIGAFVLLTEDFLAEGRVWFRNAKIGADLICTNGTFINRTDNGQGTALDAVGANISGFVSLNEGFVAQGRVWFRTAEIGGDLDCRKGKIVNRTEDGKAAALEARGVKVRGYVFLHENFAAEGSVILDNSEVGADLECRTGHFSNFTDDGQGCAFSASGAQVNGNVFIGEGFQAEGKVQLMGARVGRQLVCSGGNFSNPVPSLANKQKAGRRRLPVAEVALQLQAIKVGDVLFLGPADNLPNVHVIIGGSLSLEGAYAREFVDHVGSWPCVTKTRSGDELYCCIDLLGFEYDRMNRSVEPEERMKWLRRQPPDDLGNVFVAQSFAQLVKVLRAMGHDREARLIAADGEESRRQQWNKTAPRVRRWTLGPFWWLFGRFVGYGYRPEKLLLLLFAAWLGGALFYGEAARQGAMAPSQPELFLDRKFDDCRSHYSWIWCVTKLAPEYPAFNSYIYSADLLLPIVDLQQKRAWAPTRVQITIFGIQIPLWLLWACVWIETIFGWIGSLVLVAVASRSLIKGDEV